MRDARPICARCKRPTTVCYCAALPRLDTRTRVVILQHPRERDMPIGTARMATLALSNATLRVGMQWTREALADVLDDAILLYPGPGAKDILREPPEPPVTVICVDGTWSQARGIVNRSPVLQALPRYAFAAPEPSHYRIRKEPDDRYVSTIEALMHVLGVLEGDAERIRALLDPFHAMVDAQLAAQANAPRRSSFRRPREVKPAPAPRVPSISRDAVLVIAEANAWPRRDASSPPDELVHVALHRLATGETLSLIAPPRGALAPSTTFHTELDEATLRAGEANVIERARAWIGASPICAWGTYSIDLLGLRSELDMRAAAQRLEQRKVGSLETYGALVAATALSPLGPGRAGRRLAVLVALAQRWIAMSTTTGR
ncbi:MAG TPA: tRNA-uridine aminocarboxypropyltransferase [Kofleriaceae bacterium]|nr:tRNA-uridine aminocarboxypropyltransferase [Kofleriaceae bacterium]